ncbi:stalk domain-containing protein [Alkaliphilus transvaalensis]|uniref:stalk domain-containing protein n=1 Tax=Alkaliphilus transvaalensis TaxID=114628 RepID=UPI00047BE3F8|nr:stalk domain-containing protein [Alkaliphilus transvaalensis]
MTKKWSIIIVLVLSLVIVFNVSNVSNVYANQLSLASPTAILIDSEDGQVLYEKFADVQRPIASTSKIMTYILVMESVYNGDIRLSDKVRISKKASDTKGTSYQLKEKDAVSVNELLQSMMIISANDSAVALAEHVGGSVDNFVKMMNGKAKSLGLSSSYFVNPTGLPQDNGDQNHMTAKELAKLYSYGLSQYPNHLIPMVSKEEFYGTYKTFRSKNTNILLSTTTYIKGMKTGFTNAAGYCLVSISRVKGSNTKWLIGVVLGSNTSDIRFEESKKLIDYGLENYLDQIVVRKGDLLDYLEVEIENDRIPIEITADATKSVVVHRNRRLAKNKVLIKNIPQQDQIVSNLINQEQMIGRLLLTNGMEIEVPIRFNRGITVIINGDQMNFKSAYPKIIDGRTYISIRDFSETFNLLLEWEQSSQSIQLKNDEKSIRLITNDKRAYIEDIEIMLEEGPLLIEDRLMVPLRLITEIFNAHVQWNQEQRTINITIR